MARGAHAGQRVARFDAQPAAVNRRAAVFFGGFGVIGVVRWISQGSGARGAGFRAGFVDGASLVALAIGALFAWSSWYISAHVHRDVAFWRHVEARNRSRVWRILVISFPVVCVVLFDAVLERWFFSAGVLAAWACAIGALIVARLTGGIRASRFES